MNKKLLVGIAGISLLTCFAAVAQGQSAIIRGEKSAGIYGNIPIDSNNYLYVNCPGCTGAAAPTGANNVDAIPSVGTGLQSGVNYLYGYNGTTWDRLQVDASKFLKINCVTGCSAGSGTGANNADAVASVGTGLGSNVSYNFGYNGTTWDRLQVDGSKNLKVIVGSGSTTAVTGTVAVTKSGTWDITNAGTFATQASQAGTWNITNVSGTVSLPTGASTAAKQPALGTAGSASADVITIQGVASMTKLLVTPDSVALPANQSVNMAQVAGTTTDTNSGTKSAGTLRVIIATDQPALTNKLLVTPDSVALPANQSVNVNQIGGTTVVADPCQAVAKTSTAISQATSTQIISGTSAKKTYICSLALIAGAAENVSITAGTGSVCATGASAIVGSTTVANGLIIAANGGLTLGNGGATVASGTVNADNICILQSGSVRVSGVITWVQL